MSQQDWLSHMQYQCFKSGKTSTKDNKKFGWPSTSTDDDHNEKVCEVSKVAGNSKSLCHMILTKKLKMKCVFTKFVMHLLTDIQKENCVTVSKEEFDRSNADENFLNVMKCGYNGTKSKKRQLLQWEGKLST